MPTPSPAPSPIPAADMPALPPGWVWTTIGEIADTTSGGTPSRSHIEYYGGSIPWVKSGELRDDLISETEEQISELGLRNSSAKVFSKGTVLVALYGATVGRTGILHIDAATNQAICALFPLRESFDAKYMMYWLRSERQSLINLSVGGAQLNISQGVIRAFHFPLPPLAEQHRIVAAIETQLTRLDAGVASLKAAKAKLKRYRASVLKAACEGRLVAQDANDEPADVLRLAARRQEAGGRRQGKRTEEPSDTVGLPELPTGWCWATVEQVSSHIVDCLHTTPKFVVQGKYCIDTNSMKHGRIPFDQARFVSDETFNERIRRLRPIAGDLLFAREGTIGTAALVPENIDLCLGQRMMMFRSNECIAPGYFLWSVLSPVFESQWKPRVAGSTSPHVNIGDLRKMVLPLPPLAEQRRIVAEVERLLSVVTALEATVTANLKRAERLRQSILKRAFEGKLVAQEAR